MLTAVAPATLAVISANSGANSRDAEAPRNLAAIADNGGGGGGGGGLSRSGGGGLMDDLIWGSPGGSPELVPANPAGPGLSIREQQPLEVRFE